MKSSRKKSCNRQREAISTAFSKRESVGWLARGSSWGLRPPITLNSGSQRRAS